MKEIKRLLDIIEDKPSKLHEKDFLLTWEQSRDELEKVLYLAEALKNMRAGNIDTRVTNGAKLIHPSG